MSPETTNNPEDTGAVEREIAELLLSHHTYLNEELAYDGPLSERGQAFVDSLARADELIRRLQIEDTASKTRAILDILKSEKIGNDR